MRCLLSHKNKNRIKLQKLFIDKTAKFSPEIPEFWFVCLNKQVKSKANKAENCWAFKIFWTWFYCKNSHEELWECSQKTWNDFCHFLTIFFIRLFDSNLHKLLKEPKNITCSKFFFRKDDAIEMCSNTRFNVKQQTCIFALNFWQWKSHLEWENVNSVEERSRDRKERKGLLNCSDETTLWV